MFKHTTRPQERPRRISLVAAAVLIVAAFAFAACGDSDGSSAPPSPSPTASTISYSRVIELSQTISPDMPLWPGDPEVVFDVVATMDKDGYYLRGFTIGEHSATHMNAPNSFVADSTEAITSYTAEERVVPAVVIDASAECATNADYELTRQDVLDWEAENGEIEPGSVVLMLTGWEDKWDDPKAFMNLDASGNPHFPGFAGATTEWLLSERQIAGVGIDTHGVDPGVDTSYATNTAMAENHKIALECLGHLDELPPAGTTLVLGALQLQDGSGTPLSVIALAP